MFINKSLQRDLLNMLNLITLEVKLQINNGIDISYCRSQTYDGAVNMAGKQNGAAQKLKKNQNDRALYYHCASHEINFEL